jgi:DNA sulfur modification protein DndC
MATAKDDDQPYAATHPLGPLTLNGELLQALEERTQQTYLADARPWVIGYSGGKDSTAVVQHVWYALSKLPREKLTKPVYVISSDTLVSLPSSSTDPYDAHPHRDGAAGPGLLQDGHRSRTCDTFWVNLIGGTPAPGLRWCTRPDEDSAGKPFHQGHGGEIR